MKYGLAFLAPLVLTLGGCLSPPIPSELVDVEPFAAPEPLTTAEVQKLARAGLSEEVVDGLIRARGISDRPAAAAPTTTRLVYRELFIPVWPSYAGGRWRVGLRCGWYYRRVEETPVRTEEPAPEPPGPKPQIIDP